MQEYAKLRCARWLLQILRFSAQKSCCCSAQMELQQPRAAAAAAACWGLLLLTKKIFISIFRYRQQSWAISGAEAPLQQPKPKNGGQNSYWELKKITNNQKKFIYQKRCGCMRN